MSILFGLHGGIGNSLFCLPAIKALSRLASVNLCVEGDYDMTALWSRCCYVEKVYGPKDSLPRADDYMTGQYVPAAFRGKPVQFCGWPRGESQYARPEWAQIKLKAVGDERKETVVDWLDRSSKNAPDIDFALIPCGKPGSEWQRKKWDGFLQLANRLESRGKTVRAFGQREEICASGLLGWWDGPRSLAALPDYLLRCRVAVCTDSGIGHLASSLGIPVVMLFTATSQVKGEPVGDVFKIVSEGLPCAPCQSTPRWGACLDWRCRRIAVERVEKEAINLLTGTNTM